MFWIIRSSFWASTLRLPLCLSAEPIAAWFPALAGRSPPVPIYSLPLALAVVFTVSTILSNSSVRSRLSRLGVRRSTLSRRGGFRTCECYITGGVQATAGYDGGNVSTMVASCSRVPIFILISSFLLGPCSFYLIILCPSAPKDESCLSKSTAIVVFISFDNVNSLYKLWKYYCDI